MKTNRRRFISRSLLATAGTIAIPSWLERVKAGSSLSPVKGNIPMVISTWNHGYEANEAAWKVLDAGGSAIDAVEQGVRVPEADPDADWSRAR